MSEVKLSSTQLNDIEFLRRSEDARTQGQIELESYRSKLQCLQMAQNILTTNVNNTHIVNGNTPIVTPEEVISMADKFFQYVDSGVINNAEVTD